MVSISPLLKELLDNSNEDVGDNDNGDDADKNADWTFRHCQSCRRSCSRWKRRPAAFSTKTKRCRGWVGQDDDDGDDDDDDGDGGRRHRRCGPRFHDDRNLHDK